jgi:hypothetical protein
MRLSLFILIIPVMLFPGVIKQPETAISEMYPHMGFDKKRALLSGDEALKIEHMARQKLASKIMTYYELKGQNGPVYAVLQTIKVRSKTMTSLTFVKDGKIVRIEMIAFYEPMEYLPSSKWLKTTEGKTSSDAIQPKRDLPTITGATLSANAVSKAARLALAFVRVKLERP